MRISNFISFLLLLYCAYGLPLNKKAETKVAEGAMGSILDVNMHNGFDYFEGDIVFPPMSPDGRNAILDESLKWTSTIPYVIHSQYNFEIRELIESVLREYSVRMCIKFVPREKEDSYLMYTRDNGCFSSVGKIGNEQMVSIGSGCESYGVIIHETMHALGFWHEQSRYDRDEYVQIMWDNIQSGKEHNFNKYSQDQITVLNEPYDYASIMHYHNTAFSSNGEPTIVPLNPGGEVMGQRDGFSQIDLNKLRKLYNCPILDGWTEWTDWSECDIKCQRYRKRFCEGASCDEDIQTEWTDCNVFCIVDRDNDCQSPYKAGSYGVVTSPMYPFSYKVEVECVQTIVAPPSDNVEMKFEFLDIEDYQGICYYDWLKVYDGKDTSSPLIGTFCGTSVPSSIKSSSNSLTVQFFSDYSVSKRGFLANYYTTQSRAPVHMCHFEGDINTCGWSNDPTSDFFWTRNKGPTVSSSTGPSYDHTTGQDQGYYMYIETSSPQTNGMRARLLTPVFDAPIQGHCLEFSYNMYGDNVDSIHVMQLPQDNSVGSYTTIFSEYGNHGNDEWMTSEVTIHGGSPYKLVFEGRRGNGYMGDLAIDDVIIYSNPCDDEVGSGGEVICPEDQPLCNFLQ